MRYYGVVLSVGWHAAPGVCACGCAGVCVCVCENGVVLLLLLCGPPRLVQVAEGGVETSFLCPVCPYKHTLRKR